MKKICVCVSVLFLSMALSAVPAFGSFMTYSGSLSTDDGGIEGTGIWVTEGVTISWSISGDEAGPWLYEYVLVVPTGDVSHMILEVSDSFGEDDLLNEEGPFHGFEIDTFVPGPANPELPSDMYGIKFDNATELVFAVSFESYRNPVWGDFYAKNGNVGGSGVNTVWNSGLTDPDSDPVAKASDGSLDGHLLVPDTINIPEPATVLLLASGLLPVVWRSRRVKTVLRRL